jgi:hypothetical protein
MLAEEIKRELESALAIRTEACLRGEIAALIGAYPNARVADPATYVSAMLFDFKDLGFPDAVIMEACQIIRRALKFPPTIAEMVKVAEDRNAYWSHIPTALDRAVERRARLVEKLKHNEAVAAEATDPKWTAERERKLAKAREAYPSAFIEWESGMIRAPTNEIDAYEHACTLASPKPVKSKPRKRP